MTSQTADRRDGAALIGMFADDDEEAPYKENPYYRLCGFVVVDDGVGRAKILWVSEMEWNLN